METNAAPESKAQTILIAEDEAMIRLIVAETLRDAGYKVREAADGQEALDILKRDASIDLLVSDMKMPGLNGYQLVEAGTTLRPDLKVLLMTGYAQDPVPESMTQAGVRVLYKPFDINELPFLAKAILKV
jgi:CheY-like chemotaxis protein